MILAEGDKSDMDRQLRRALTGSSVEWHTRQVRLLERKFSVPVIALIP